MNFFQKLRDFITVPSHSRTAALLAVLVIVASIPLSVALTQQQQTLKQHASAPSEISSCEVLPAIFQSDEACGIALFRDDCTPAIYEEAKTKTGNDCAAEKGQICKDQHFLLGWKMYRCPADTNFNDTTDAKCQDTYDKCLYVCNYSKLYGATSVDCENKCKNDPLVKTACSDGTPVASVNPPTNNTCTANKGSCIPTEQCTVDIGSSISASDCKDIPDYTCCQYSTKPAPGTGTDTCTPKGICAQTCGSKVASTNGETCPVAGEICCVDKTTSSAACVKNNGFYGNGYNCCDGLIECADGTCGASGSCTPLPPPAPPTLAQCQANCYQAYQACELSGDPNDYSCTQAGLDACLAGCAAATNPIVPGRPVVPGNPVVPSCTNPCTLATGGQGTCNASGICVAASSASSGTCTGTGDTSCGANKGCAFNSSDGKYYCVATCESTGRQCGASEAACSAGVVDNFFCSGGKVCCNSSAAIIPPGPGGTSVNLVMSLSVHPDVPETDLIANLPVEISLRNPSSNTLVNGVPAGKSAFTKGQARKYAASGIVLTNVAPGQYHVIARKDNLIAKSQLTLSTGQTSATTPEATLVYGDLNNDNNINSSDYNTFRDCWRKSTSSTPSCTVADLDKNNTVDQIDYNTFLRGFAAWNK